MGEEKEGPKLKRGIDASNVIGNLNHCRTLLEMLSYL